jgi:hypothetical protein
LRPVGDRWPGLPRGESAPLPTADREVGGDDRVELGVQEPGVRADEVGECLRGAAGRRFAVPEGCTLGCGVVGHGRCPPGRSGAGWGQALICLRSVSVLPVMVILRGLAFSAIGIRRVSTPAS